MRSLGPCTMQLGWTQHTPGSDRHQHTHIYVATYMRLRQKYRLKYVVFARIVMSLLQIESSANPVTPPCVLDPGEATSACSTLSRRTCRLTLELFTSLRA